MPDNRQPDWEELRWSLKRRRSDARLTLDQLAEKSSVARRTLVQLEAGTTKGSVETWFRLAEAFDVEVGELLVPLYGATRHR